MLSREQPFAFALHGSQPLMTGVFDVLARESPEYWLVLDYKTDRVKDDTDLELLLERDYSIQRLIYALAALRAGARQVEVVHWFLERPEQWVTHSFSDSQHWKRSFCRRWDGCATVVSRSPPSRTANCASPARAGADCAPGRNPRHCASARPADAKRLSG